MTERAEPRIMEARSSGEGGEDWRALRYHIIGAGDLERAFALLRSEAPSAQFGVRRSQLLLEPLAADVWLGTAIYGEPPTQYWLRGIEYVDEQAWLRRRVAILYVLAMITLLLHTLGFLLALLN